MKKVVFALAAVSFLFVVFACNKKSESIVFEQMLVADSLQNYTADTNAVFNVKIDLCYVSGEPQSLVDTINNSIYAWLASYLCQEKDCAVSKENIKTVVADEIKTSLKEPADGEEYVDNPVSIQQIEGESKYQNKKIVSIAYQWYQYSGGAHGTYGISTFNYAKEDCSVVDLANLTTDMDAFLKIAQTKFVEKYGNISDFWFENNEFYLPKTFYFTNDELIFYYHIYEIASYVEGAFELKLKNDEIKNIVPFID